MRVDVRRLVWLAPGLAFPLLASLTSAAALGHSALHKQQADEAETLGPGVQRERALRAGQTHAYQIRLDAGQLLHAVVTPHGIDISVTLVGPDGRDLLAVDLSPDQVTPETVMAVAQTEGRYEINVKSAHEGAPDGRYVVRIEAPRPANDMDAIRVRAMRELETGVRLRDRMETAAWERAADRLAAALSGFREAGDRGHQARALIEAAENAFYLERPEARDQARAARARYRDLGDQAGSARAAFWIAAIHDRYGEPEALASLSEALALNEAAGNRTLQAYALISLGALHRRAGETERAIGQYQQALLLARRMRIPRVEIPVLNNLGVAAKELGDYRLSLKYYQECLGLMRGGDRMEPALLINIGSLYRLLGEDEKSRAAHEAALELARRHGNADIEAGALSALGVTHYRLGAHKQALQYHEQALAIRRRLVARERAQAASLEGVGLAMHRLGNSERAIENLSEALRIWRATASPQGESDSLMYLALVERDRGDLAAALDHIEKAVSVTDLLRSRVVSPDLRASFVASAQDHYELHIDVLMRLHQQRPDQGFAARALEASERGRARVLLESLLEARANIRQGIDAALLERERTSQRQLDSASARLSRLLSRQSDPKELEAARKAIETLSAEYRQLQVRIRQESPGYAALTQPRPLTVAEIQRDLVDADTLLLEYALGEKRSWLWTVTPTEIATFELPPRHEIESAARQMYRGLTARQPRPDESAAARAARVAQADAEWRRQSIALGRMLLGPAAAHLDGAWRGKRLLIVAADVLQYVPFSALSDPAGQSQPLVVDHEVVNLPSASVLAVIRRENEARKQPPKSLAVLADPVFDIDDPRITAAPRKPDRPRPVAQRENGTDAPAATFVARAMRSVEALGEMPVTRLSRLPFSRQEARAISALVPAAQRFEAIDFRASRATATGGELGAYRLVHFATHGLLNSEHPELSGLVLSLVDRDGNAQDGFLRLNDIYNMRLPAEVVVLSACQTALGKEIRGEGLVGLTRGFMYAGARRVVASLWQVDDLATSELMRLFYRAMLRDGLRPAAALRAAQRELARQPRWASPFYWSAFVLQGEWR